MSSTGQPMPQNFQDEIQEMIIHAAGRDVVDAVREADRRVREMWSHMTDEEIADWVISGEGV